LLVSFLLWILFALFPLIYFITSRGKPPCFIKKHIQSEEIIRSFPKNSNLFVFVRYLITELYCTFVHSSLSAWADLGGGPGWPWPTLRFSPTTPMVWFSCCLIWFSCYQTRHLALWNYCY
jgi:hypothetical protein